MNSVSPAISSKEQFDRQSTHYDKQWNDWNAENLEWLLHAANPQPHEIALDVATGTGFTALAFAPKVAHVTGLDVSTGMLAEATRRAGEQRIANVDFREGSAEKLPFDDESFDLVTCRIAAHHFISVQSFIAEAFRVLKSVGRLLIADTTVDIESEEADRWQNEIERLRDPSHVRNYSWYEWSKMLHEAGFMLQEYHVRPAIIPLTLNDWLKKSGCVGEAAKRVREMLADATPAITREFDIRRLEGDDYAFAWHRVVLHAIK